MFPDNAIIAGVSPLDKHADDKYSVTNFQPVSVLNTFSKTYEKIVKDFLISKMEHHFSLFPDTANALLRNMCLLGFYRIEGIN